MPGFEFFGEPYPRTSPPEMDPSVRSQILALFEGGADLEEVEELFGPENVTNAAANNIDLMELIEQRTSEGDNRAA